jgi:class 3 adenylate cyclase/predicted ATPase
MTFQEVLAQAIAWLRHDRRLSYRALKRQFALDKAYLEDLKFELIEVKRLAVDYDGKMLVWTGDADTAAPPTAPSTPPPDAERRQLTVLFCDVVNSTRLAGQLDPEDWREVVRSYQATCAAVIHRFEGYIAQYLGDGLLVYFGYPRAHENDAERAVYAGLDILTAMQTLNARLAQDKGFSLDIRVGIHTGLVVVGEVGGNGRQELLALGDTPNIASRIQGLAAPNTVLISVDTHRLVQGYFTYQELNVQTLRGLSQPMSLYQVYQTSEAQSRMEVAATRGLTPLVGREQEVALLLVRWAQVQEGMGQVVVLSGEAGIGKSRLVHVLTERVGSRGLPHMAFRCSPYYTNSALYPVIEHLERLLGFRQDEMTEAKLARLEGMLKTQGLPLAEVVPLFAMLLSLPLPPRYPPLQLSPQKQRQKTQEALVAWLVEEGMRQPVLAVWEDLQWADPSTLELLSLTIDRIPPTHQLLLLTCRPEFPLPWSLSSHLTQVTLSRFSRPHAEAMILRITGGKALPVEVLDQIVARADGIPLFIEEVTRMVLESGLLREVEGCYELTGPLPPLAIPTTLQDALMARLDRLVTAKGVAQLGAVIGRHFAYGLLRAVAPLDDATLQRELGRLVEAEVLYQHGMPPQAIYTFKHALIQEAAYQSLLRRTRQQYHQRIAQVLEAQFPEARETQPELLAQHFTEASFREQAMSYWHKAGQRAVERSAYREAVAHLTRGLELRRSLPDTPEHARHELALQTTLGLALVATRGYGAPDVAHAYTRALELCRQVGEPAQLFPVQGGLWQFYAVRAEYQTARGLAEQLLTLAQNAQDAALLLGAHTVLGQTFHMLGAFVRAREHIEQGIALYDPQQHRSLAFLLGGEDPGVACLGFAACTLWLLGYPEQALSRMQEALTLAEALGSPFNLAWALRGAAWLHQLRRERLAAQGRAETLMALASEQGFAYWAALGTMFRGWALAEARQGEEGMTQIRQGLATIRATGAELGRPHFLALLAEAYGNVGQPEAGLPVLAEALEAVEQNGECYYQAELYRLKGELLLALSGDNHAEAEICFHRALDVSRQQQARSWELRVAISLSRLWQRQGQRQAARRLLAETYNWFTEGFSTADLQEAQGLLATLS